MASFFAFVSFPIPAPARGRRVRLALPSRIISHGKSTHCFTNKVPSSYCPEQWKEDVDCSLKESPTASAPSGGLAGKCRIPGPHSRWAESESACEM